MSFVDKSWRSTSAGRVKGGEAGTRSVRTLEASEHGEKIGVRRIGHCIGRHMLTVTA